MLIHMIVEVNWNIIGLGVIGLCAVAIAAVTYWFCDRTRMRHADKRLQHQFEREMSAVQLPEYNGDTYALPRYSGSGWEWTPESLAYLADEQAYADPFPTTEFPAYDEPVPASTLSGPLPALGALTGVAGDFMAQLRADNAAFLANLELQ